MDRRVNHEDVIEALAQLAAESGLIAEWRDLRDSAATAREIDAELGNVESDVVAAQVMFNARADSVAREWNAALMR